MHVLENGICTTCEPHVFENGICRTCETDALDVNSLALLTALNELDGAVRAKLAGSALADFNAKHPRGPSGKFRTLVDRIKDAVTGHDGSGDPFEAFDREQLRKVAKARGIPLERGESRDSIAQKLLGHLGDSKPKPAAKPVAKAPAKPPRKRLPAAKPASKATVANSAKPFHRNLDGIEDLARAVEDGQPPSQRRALTGGVSADTELHTLKDGTKVVYKYGGNAEAEQGASMIARALGLDAPRVYRNHPSAVYMDYVGNAKTWDQIREAAGENMGGSLSARYKALHDTDDAKLIGLLDLMIVNGDRNAGNWMVDDTGKIIPIDHGHSFWDTYVGQPGRIIRPAAIDGTFSGAYLSEPRKWGPNDLTADDVAEIRSRLQKLRPDFEHIGRKRWLDYALAVLDKVEPFALGERNLIAGVR